MLKKLMIRASLVGWVPWVLSISALVAMLLAGVSFQPTQVALASSPRGPTHNYRAFPTAVLTKSDTTTTRSFSIPGTRGYGLVTVYLWHEDHNTLSRVYMDCTGQYASRDYVIQDCTLAFGDCASNPARWHTQPPITGTLLWPWRIDVMGYERVDCVLTFTNGSAGDSVQADASMMTQ